jgi:dTDP-4-dehydrorhamnose 3,5-epimerase
MIITPLKISGAFQIDIERADDERGFFARCFCREDLCAHGIDFPVAQCSISGNRARHTLRGMHYQEPPHGETKLVRCTAGCIWDCIVDLRPGSPTYRQWSALELSAANRRTLLVPECCAHGFLTLTADAEVFYMISSSYEPLSARGVRWDDPAFGIDWPAPPEVISDKDRSYPDHVAGSS